MSPMIIEITQKQCETKKTPHIQSFFFKKKIKAKGVF
jgi:hypothetical protein